MIRFLNINIQNLQLNLEKGFALSKKYNNLLIIMKLNNLDHHTSRKIFNSIFKKE